MNLNRLYVIQFSQISFYHNTITNHEYQLVIFFHSFFLSFFDN